jgi:hypothetical protein
MVLGDTAAGRDHLPVNGQTLLPKPEDAARRLVLLADLPRDVRLSHRLLAEATRPSPTPSARRASRASGAPPSASRPPASTSTRSSPPEDQPTSFKIVFSPHEAAHGIIMITISTLSVEE